MIFAGEKKKKKKALGEEVGLGSRKSTFGPRWQRPYLGYFGLHHAESREQRAIIHLHLCQQATQRIVQHREKKKIKMGEGKISKGKAVKTGA